MNGAVFTDLHPSGAARTAHTKRRARAGARTRAIALGSAVLALGGGAAAWFTVPYGTTHYHPTYAVRLDTPEFASGWADDVFIGKVTAREGLRRTNGDRLLWTTYRVEVRNTLKGEVSGSVRVAQEGGDDPLRRQRIVVGEAPALEVGRTYVLATRLAPDGWHTAPSNFHPVDLSPAEGGSDSGTDMSTVWEKGVAHPTAQRHTHPSAVSRAKDPSALYARAHIG
ncbi:hypothetical protein SBI_06085 [Streptomyces bingchenggensis BCW-1]|uniref:Uncharacterized protein n=1 Tax=Streptomyces bingchenggensis (strain BCW-1) TaxID=749414 RepID=D7CI05_STRBB|nr:MULTISPECIES: hypothetical protein [Streptomyces]ADI09205.1 hypothetical protein SBI_06085 [Streptomyces bingchenggensis BCW-1]